MGNFIKGVGIFYKSEIRSISKNADELHPFYEAFTNSWESFDEVEEPQKYIKLYLHHHTLADTSLEFDKFVIEDNGIGLNEENFNRLCTLRQDSKAPKNKGTGRIQYLHFFDKTEMESVYEDQNKMFLRKVSLSKSDQYLNQNAFIYAEEPKAFEGNRHTRVTFSGPQEKDLRKYNELTVDNLKDAIIAHYMSLFCSHKCSLPQIELHHFIDNEDKEQGRIEASDIPEVDYSSNFSINPKKVGDGDIVTIPSAENFKLESFKISANKQKQNQLFLLSKGEISGNNIEVPVPKKNAFDGYRYIFMISGDYLDSHDTDSRGLINLVTEAELKKKQKDNAIFNDIDEYVTIDDLTYHVKQEINRHYNIFQEKQQECEAHIKELEEAFLLNKSIVEKVISSISLDDSDEKILEKIYKAESEEAATRDAKLRKQQREIESLDPVEENYLAKLQNLTKELVKNIPLRNRVELSKYVAHRKIVLDAFQKILETEEKVIQKEDHANEEVLHNLIFKQHSDDPSNSDLWLINEEYIYFKGSSESELGSIEYDGSKIFKESLTAEEEAYKKKCHENAGLKRPDILLFPSEGKCLIIEFKAPSVNVSDHLGQINQYASLIHNLSKDEYKFDSFYGYLIGENIDTDDIRDKDTDFKYAPNLKYLFRPSKEIVAKFKLNPGWLYTEIIKYSTLLERAKLRNKVFIDKLTKQV